MEDVIHVKDDDDEVNSSQIKEEMKEEMKEEVHKETFDSNNFSDTTY